MTNDLRLKPRLRVLVVDDSPLQRGLLLALLQNDPDIEGVGWAADGPDAIRAALRLRPDVIMMDLRMPAMDGLEATRQILRQLAVPIVIVTASLARNDRQTVRQAFDAGALAILEKPTFGAEGQRQTAELLQTLKSMAKVRVIRRHETGRQSDRSSQSENGSAVRPQAIPAVVAIAASTGGPQALRAILPRLPANFKQPILVVQHIAADFVAGIVDWLAPQCALPINVARAGIHLSTPGIYIAPSEHHLVVRGRTLLLTNDAPSSGHRPSATVLFRSLAVDYGRHALGIQLTGMGDDGAEGLLALRQAGGISIVQDEPSSIVFGMPAAAIRLGAAEYVRPLEEIAPLVIKLCEAQGER